MSYLEAVIASKLGYPHQETQVQPDGKDAIVLVQGDVRAALFVQKYNGRFRAMTDSLARPSDKLGGVAVNTVWFDADKPDHIAALKEIALDADCVIIKQPVMVSVQAPILPVRVEEVPAAEMVPAKPTLTALKTKVIAITGMTTTDAAVAKAIDDMLPVVTGWLRTKAVAIGEVAVGK